MRGALNRGCVLPNYEGVCGMIKVRNLSKWYGPVLAVDDVSFDVPDGQVVGFLGPNGAGKSTTLKILTCYLPASSGKVTVDGKDVLGDSLAVRRCIGYMPENVPLPNDMRVEEYLHYRAALRDVPRRERHVAVDRVAERCWLSKPEDMMRRRIDQLSRGYRQRVGLAEVLLHDPKVLVLDEPTSGLDPAQIREMRELIGELGADRTVILSSHILAEVEQTCSQLIIIAGGKLVASGASADLRGTVIGGGRVVVELKGDAATLTKALQAVDGVSEVDSRSVGTWQQFTVTPSGEMDPRSAIAALAAQEGWAMRELRRELASLEEFFVQITYQQNQHNADVV
jgi:ABC-2 type transport system ATP-binding protein